MAGKTQSSDKEKPDIILHIKLFEGESDKVDEIIKFFEDGRPKKFTVIEALSEYIQKHKALSAGIPVPNVTAQQPPEDEGKSFLSKM